MGASDNAASNESSMSCGVCGHWGEFEWPPSFRNGTCEYCGAHTRTLKCSNCGATDSFNLRERLRCPRCGSISRDRALVGMLGKCLGRTGPLCDWGKLGEVKIMVTSGYRAHPEWLSKIADYYNTTYLQGASRVRGRNVANLEDLHFDSDFFDFVLSSDVLEHVRLYELALRHIYRVLKPNDWFLPQAPYTHEWEKNVTRVRVSQEGQDVFLAPPEYHAEKALLYRVFGRELLSELRETGFALAFLRYEDREHAMSPQHIILCCKASYVPLTHLLDPRRPFFLPPETQRS